MQDAQALSAVALVVTLFFLMCYFLQLTYNYAIVDGLSRHPKTGEARLAHIDYVQAVLLYVLLVNLSWGCRCTTVHSPSS